MVIKVYVSLISCNQEIKKNQQRTIMILESKKIPYVAIDITDPSQEEAKEYMTSTAVPKPNAKVPVTPQIFNEADYCGDFDQLDMANECDTLGDFLKLSDEEKKSIKIGITGILPEDRKKAQEEQKNLVESAQLTNGVTAREDSGEKTTNGEAAPAEEPAAVAADAEGSSEAAPTEEASAEAVTEPEKQQSPPPVPADTDAPATQETETVAEPAAEPAAAAAAPATATSPTVEDDGEAEVAVDAVASGEEEERPELDE